MAVMRQQYNVDEVVTWDVLVDRAHADSTAQDYVLLQCKEIRESGILLRPSFQQRPVVSLVRTATQISRSRAPRGDRPTGRTPRASACGCTRHSAARRPEGAALNKEGKSEHARSVVAGRSGSGPRQGRDEWPLTCGDRRVEVLVRARTRRDHEGV